VTGQPKYEQVAAIVRVQISEGILRPGQPAPSGARLARATGYSAPTCRKALRVLMNDGVLISGPSAYARPRVAVTAANPAEQNRADVSRTLSSSLAALRRAAGLTQPELATPG
jgi:DNA-binding transcriptional regulator YhcF (GntR family)